VLFLSDIHVSGLRILSASSYVAPPWTVEASQVFAPTLSYSKSLQSLSTVVPTPCSLFSLLCFASLVEPDTPQGHAL
jgi:hypothetical protein